MCKVTNYGDTGMKQYFLFLRKFLTHPDVFKIINSLRVKNAGRGGGDLFLYTMPDRTEVKHMH